MPKEEIKTERELSLLLFGLLLLLLSAATTTIEAALASSTAPSPLFNSTTTTTTATATTLLYDNPNYGIQIRYPQDWAYIDSGAFSTGEAVAAVIFMPAIDALQFRMTPPSTSVTVLTLQLPFGNMDVRLLADYILSSSAPQDRDYQLISTNPNATLSGMPAYEAVAISLEPEENRTKSYVVMAIQGNRAYTVAYESQESTFEQFLPVARDMINSFTIAQ
ncbi:MAG: hypothetical protein M3275_00920 [Thermoproteota archaeon]|nr:hypothetical protein [Thermoproteota archaeon]